MAAPFTRVWAKGWHTPPGRRTETNRTGANSSTGPSPPDRGVQPHPHHRKPTHPAGYADRPGRCRRGTRPRSRVRRWSRTRLPGSRCRGVHSIVHSVDIDQGTDISNARVISPSISSSRSAGIRGSALRPYCARLRRDSMSRHAELSGTGLVCRSGRWSGAGARPRCLWRLFLRVHTGPA